MSALGADLLRISLGAGLLALAWAHEAPGVGAQAGEPTEPLLLETVSGAAGRLAVGGPADGVTVLDFFASWCSSCERSLPRLERAPAAAGVRWVSVSVDDSPELARRAARDWGLTRTVVFDEGGRAAKRFGIRSLPSLVVIAPDGTVATTAAGSLSEAELERLLAKP
jgi:cytochrome c biogenesis protein CcmG, thiol:disulfide interchange protein DsbE